MRRVMVRYTGEARPGGGERGARPRRVRGARRACGRTASTTARSSSRTASRFVHLASQEGEESPLGRIEAFRRFQENIRERCDEPPVLTRARRGRLVPLRRERIVSGAGTKDDPWKLKTPPQTSEYEMYLDERDGKEVIVCVVGKTTLLYDARAIDDLHAMLKAHGDWIELGSADEQKPAKEGTVEAWGRSRGQPGRRLVRPQEGPARPVRHVHAAAARGARHGRGRAQPAQQPDARALRQPV